jgi:hypothetical protein
LHIKVAQLWKAPGLEDEITSQIRINKILFAYYPLLSFFTMSQQHDLTSSDGVKSYLQTNDYPSCVAVEQLAGGSSGFTFRARLGDDRKYLAELTT